MKPHKNKSKIPSVAIYWDYENVRLYRHVSVLLRFAEKLGCVVTKAVFAHWQRESLKALEILTRDHLAIMDVLEEGKNSADRALIQTCRADMQSPNAPDIVIIVSGDRDFIPLIWELSTKGKHVIVIGKSGASRKTLPIHADAFYHLDELAAVSL